ncbi:hypothetical protein Tco_1424552, partial [Tanacetum coccineum]
MAGLLFNKFKGDSVRGLLVQGIWQGSALSLRRQGILHGLRKRCCWFRHKNQANDLEAYDSDCDDISPSKVILMANLSSYGSDVLSKIDLENKRVNESLTDELERYKERVKTFKQRHNVDLNNCEKLIDSQMDDMIRNRNALKQEIDSLKQTLSKHVKEREFLLTTLSVFKKESKEKENKYMDKKIGFEKKIKELDNIIYKVALGYQNPFYLKKAQRIKPMFYDGNVISKKHDVIYVVDEEETMMLERRLQVNFQNVIHADFVPVVVLFANTKCLVNDNLESERLIQKNDHLFELLLSHDIVHIRVNSLATLTNYTKMEQDYIDEYSENLVLKAELAKKEEMVENKYFDEVKAKLDAKDVSIANLRKHIESLKRKNVIEKDATLNKAKVISPEMFKLDLEPSSPKVLKNRDAHIDYIKHTQENADILRGLVKHARSLRPLDSDLDSPCKYAKRIQEVLVYVTTTCPSLTKPSEKLVVITPLNKNKKVRFAEHATSSSSIQKHVYSYNIQDSNKPMLPSTGMKSSTYTS